LQREAGIGPSERKFRGRRGRSIPAWLSFNPDSMTGNVLTVPVREQIEVPVNEQLVVEFYAR
jgi:ribosomal protein S4